ncbi:laccase [Boletus edulis BED1]|uniref:Laccase n=1 Tax=Boletus edulis BED1 TaxID=1328754 RepID=A0AAD4BMI1_BOLED|nr:laccase [Boletus edulis BED1]
MLFLPVLAFLSFSFSNAISVSKRLDSGITVLGPVSQMQVANGFIAPDGYNRSASLVNGALGPLIRANKGDRFSIQVTNELTDDTMPLDTSIHWHGIFQRDSNWADGPSFITQCPIRQQKTFVQTFTPVGQTGTYWWHSHYTTQYCDGVRGALVIYDPHDPLRNLYDVDDETTVITLSDWYHIPSIQLGELFVRVIANSTLINGRGRYAGGPSAPLSVVNVQQGLRYRFRLVSIACDPSFNFTIDGHRMTIIEVDGTEVEPVEVDSIPILVAQRYSVVITAARPVGNYWIRALSNLPNASFDGGQNLAILRYDGAPDQDPTTVPTYELAFDEGSLHPLLHPGAPGIPEIGKADVSLSLAPGINASGFFTLGGVSFVDPGVPVLLQILSGARQASQLLPQGSVYTLPLNKVIELNFPNPNAAPGGPHPFHLHGHNFDVVRIAGSTEPNFKNPVRRDVVSIGTGATDNVTIRFVTDNAGPWFLHCHINWHLNHGLAAVMAEAPNETAAQESKVIPQDWFDLCQN